MQVFKHDLIIVCLSLGKGGGLHCGLYSLISVCCVLITGSACLPDSRQIPFQWKDVHLFSYKKCVPSLSLTPSKMEVLWNLDLDICSN